MLGTPGGIYDLLNGGHLDLIYSGAGSVLCALTNTVAGTQGYGAMMGTEDPEYDSSDVLRGLPSFTGMSYDAETGLMVSVDQAEIGVPVGNITIGRPIKGWTGKMRNLDGSDIDFRVLDVMQDRTLGVFRIRLSILKAAGLGRRVDRAGVSGV